MNQMAISGASTAVRASFIRKTYSHLFAAILGFAGIEVFMFQTGMAEGVFNFMAQYGYLAIFAPFLLFSWIASRFAQARGDTSKQYMGLGLMIVAEAIIFAPILYLANMKTGGTAIESAALGTFLGFGGLTMIAFATRADFSWMGKILSAVGLGIFVVMICGMVFGFSLGVYFSAGMIVFASFAILHDTSNIIHHYSEDDYVAASLQLFASVAMMFWYLLQIFSSRD